MRRFALILAAGLVLAGCDSYSGVRKEGTIEAYEQYLKDNPGSRWKAQAEMELETMYAQQARDEPNLENYDAYLERWDNGVLRKQILEEREEFLFRWAEDENTEEGWQKFLDEYPAGDKTRKQTARAGIKVAKYAGNLTMSDVRMEQVNLAEDPEGPLNGWGFYVDVTNDGPETLEGLWLTIFYLDADGNRVHRDKWALVAPDFGIPMEEEKKIPMKPGETRTWEWTTGDLPSSWAKKVKVQPSAIRFVKYDPRRESGSE